MMVDLGGIEDFQALLARLGQDEIRMYYDTLKGLADSTDIPPNNRIMAIKEMRTILERYAKGQEVEIPKFIEVGRKKFEAMEAAHAATIKVKNRLDDGEPIEDILHLGENE